MPSMTFLSKYQPQLLSVLRIVAGLLFLEYGTAKLFHFPHVAMFDHIPPVIYAAAVIEFVGGSLVVLGLSTRIAALICSGEMAVAFWLGHVARTGTFWPILNEGGLAVLFSFVFLFFAAAGPGPWSFDRR